MGEGIDGCVAVGGDAALLGIDPRDTGLERDVNLEVGRAQIAVMARGIGRGWRAVEGLVKHLLRGLVFLRGGLELEAPAVFYLVVPEQFEVLVVHHVLHLCPFERHEHVVLVGGHEAVGGGHDVAVVGKGEVVHRVLARQVGFFVE